MADTYAEADPGSGGPKFAVDQDGQGVDWPYSKGAFGAGGTQTEVALGPGRGWPVQPDQGAVFPSGPTPLAAGANVPSSSGVLENSRVLKNAPGNLYNVYVFNPGLIDAIVLVLDAVAVPADGPVVPKLISRLPPGGEANIDYTSMPARFTTGIVVVLSSDVTTPFNKLTDVGLVGFITGNVQ